MNTTRSVIVLITILLACVFATKISAQVHDETYQKTLTLVGSKTKEDITYTLYLPPGYSESTGPYPIIFFLHGAGGGNASAEVLRSCEADRKSKLIGDCIFVFPDKYAGTIWRDGAKDKLPVTSVLKELLPFLESKSAVSKDCSGRTVMGFSMEAAGSIYWGAKYMDLFSVAVALDGGGGTSIDDNAVRNYMPHYCETQDELRNSSVNLRSVQGAIITRGFRASLDELKIPYDYERLPRNVEDYEEDSHCRNKRAPRRKCSTIRRA